MNNNGEVAEMFLVIARFPEVLLYQEELCIGGNIFIA